MKLSRDVYELLLTREGSFFGVRGVEFEDEDVRREVFRVRYRDLV